MNLPTLNNGMAFGALKPIGEYKGPILRLTKADKEKIAQYEKQIALLDLERMKLADYSDSLGCGVNKINGTRKKFVVEEYGSNYYSDRLCDLNSDIDDLRKLVKQIKIDRLEKQKARLAKKAQEVGKFDIQG